MGKNTPARRDFIMENLRIEEDVIEDAAALVAENKANQKNAETVEN
jgi:hypothetical protein